MNYCFGVDIGGTTIKMGLFQFDGKMVDKWEIKTRTENAGEAILPDVTKAINEIKSGKVEYRLDKTNIIHLGFGKVSFGADKLAENYETIMNAIIKAKPAAAKGQYIKSVSVTTTMGPGIFINQK